MKEEFVTKGIAKQLKGKGFKEGCFGYYLPGGDILIFNYGQWRGGIYEDCLYSHNSLEEDVVGSDLIDVPTVSQVLKWLREEKKIYVFIDFYLNGNNERCWVYTIRDMEDDSTYVLPDGCKKCHSYEEASLAGIEYAIDNLI